MTEDEAKAEYKARREDEDAILDKALRISVDDRSLVEDVVTTALVNIGVMRANLAATQARSTQLIDESRALRRALLRMAERLQETASQMRSHNVLNDDAYEDLQAIVIESRHQASSCTS